MKPPDQLARRRARVRRHLAKRPMTVEVTHQPDPAARDRLVDLLTKLLGQR